MDGWVSGWMDRWMELVDETNMARNGNIGDGCLLCFMFLKYKF